MKTKRIAISGLAFDSTWLSRLLHLRSGEEDDMKRLSEEAQKGWLVTGIKGMSYELVQTAPQNLIYAIDYKEKLDQDYIEIFKAGGWEYVCSAEYIHLFKAKHGTTPLHTDIESKLTILTDVSKKFTRYTLTMLFVLACSLALSVLTAPWKIGFITLLLLIFTLAALVGVIFTGMPLMGYLGRVNKLKKQSGR